MGFFNLFTVNENKNPIILSIETSDPELIDKTVFDLKGLTQQDRHDYFVKVSKMANPAEVLLQAIKAEEIGEGK